MISLIITAFFSILTFCYLVSRLTLGRCSCKVCLIGKTAIVTGGNSGIGYEVALTLASRGCKVIIADINTSDGPKNKIIKETNNPNIIRKYINLASFASIRQFARDINKNEGKIDILVNNAGVGASPEEFTEDNLNATMQINYFGPFLLTHLLIGLLKKSAPCRIIFTSSSLAFINNLNDKNLDKLFQKGIQNEFAVETMYSNSKVCTIVSANGFAEKLKGTGVTSNSLHPGYVASRIFDKTLSVTGLHWKVLALKLLSFLYAKNINEGAQTTIHLALSNNSKETSGQFFTDCKVYYFTPSLVKNSHLCKRIWEESERAVKLSDDEKL